jgi:hypothetical protein
MTMMNSELYDALKEAGATEEKSRAAAASMAVYDQRFAKIETDLSILKWMTGTVIVLVIGGFSLILRLLLDVSR